MCGCAKGAESMIDGWTTDSSDAGSGWDAHSVWAVALGAWLLVTLLLAHGL